MTLYQINKIFENLISSKHSILLEYQKDTVIFRNITNSKSITLLSEAVCDKHLTKEKYINRLVTLIKTRLELNE